MVRTSWATIAVVEVTSVQPISEKRTLLQAGGSPAPAAAAWSAKTAAVGISVRASSANPASPYPHPLRAVPARAPVGASTVLTARSAGRHDCAVKGRIEYP